MATWGGNIDVFSQSIRDVNGFVTDADGWFKLADGYSLYSGATAGAAASDCACSGTGLTTLRFIAFTKPAGLRNIKVTYKMWCSNAAPTGDAYMDLYLKWESTPGRFTDTDYTQITGSGGGAVTMIANKAYIQMTWTADISAVTDGALMSINILRRAVAADTNQDQTNVFDISFWGSYI